MYLGDWNPGASYEALDLVTHGTKAWLASTPCSQGPQGDPGATGPQGATGATGPAAAVAAQILFGGADSNLPTGGVSYVSLGSSLLRATAANEVQVAQVMPIGGTISNFNVLLDGTAGSSNSYVFTIRKNMATDSAVTCTIAGTSDVSCADNVNSISFSAGELLTIKITPSGGPSGRRMAWTAKFVPSP